MHKYTDSSIDAYAHMYGKHPYTHTHAEDTEIHRRINAQHAMMLRCISYT